MNRALLLIEIVLRRYLVGLFLSLSLSSFALAEEVIPRLCTGFNPIAKDWDPVGTSVGNVQEANCPPGYAYLRTTIVTGTPRPAASIPIRGTCCPLPEGILSGEHVWETEHCPKDFVATGTKSERQVHWESDNWEPAVAEWEKMPHYLRCTKIDTARFQLSELAETLNIGLRLDFPRKFGEVRSTTESRIPVGIRYGVTREGKFDFQSGGCIGFPWGSILTGKIDKFCGMEFRFLQYKGIAGDPPAGTPVQIFPDCLSIDDPLSPEPKCLKP